MATVPASTPRLFYFFRALRWTSSPRRANGVTEARSVGGGVDAASEARTNETNQSGGPSIGRTRRFATPAGLLAGARRTLRLREHCELCVSALLCVSVSLWLFL
jgi:hypothetical protein